MQRKNRIRLAYVSTVSAAALATALADPDGVSALSGALVVLTLPSSVVLSPVVFALMAFVSVALIPAAEALGISENGMLVVLSVLGAVIAALVNTLVLGLLLRGARRCRLRHARRGVAGT
ncbi:hypothetical protein ACFRI7_27600 [Streptomyces sp. NPDC056716]|uniref:hypothetical protein n=1 Tax=unclassified Streptomyces TaxID=2593676 RepID=UPI0036873BC4